VTYHNRERPALNTELALQRLMAICSRKETSEWDVLKKLNTWKVDSKKHNSILKELIKQGFVCNQRFAMAYARDKAKFNKWGPRKIERGLVMQKIDPDIIKEALLAIEEVQGTDMLFDLLKRKAATIKVENNNDLKVKLLRFGLSRGFDYSKVMSAVSIIVKKQSINSDE
jgi:Uncharacterized protein conserved in bacteria